MIGSKFNFIVSAAIFASTVYFLWIKIKRNTNFFNRDVSDEKSLENTGKDSLDLQSENDADNESISCGYPEIIDSLTDVTIDSQLETEEIIINFRGTNFVNSTELNYDSICDHLNVNETNNSQSFTDSIAVIGALDKSLEDMLCNNLKNIDINHSISQDHVMSSELCGSLISKKTDDVLEGDDVIEISGDELDGEEINNQEQMVEKDAIDTSPNNFMDQQGIEINAEQVYEANNLIEEKEIVNIRGDKIIDQQCIIEVNENANTEINIIKIESDITEEYITERQNISTKENSEDVQANVFEISQNVTEGTSIIAKEEADIIEESFIERQDFKMKDAQEDLIETCQNVNEEISINEDINTEVFSEDVIETSQNVTEEISIIEKEEGEITEESFIERQDIKIEDLQDDLVAIGEKVIAEIPIKEESIIESQYINTEQSNEDVQEDVIETCQNVTEEISIIEKEEGKITEESFMERHDIKIGDLQDLVEISEKVRQEISINAESIIESQEKSEDVQAGVIETLQNVTEEISIIEKEEGEITEESFMERQDLKMKDAQEDLTETCQKVNEEISINEDINTEVFSEDVIETSQNVTEEISIIEKEEGEITEESFIDRQDIKIGDLQDDLVAIGEKVIAEIPINEESIIESQYINIEQDNENVQEDVIETSQNVTEEISIIEKEEGEITEESFIDRQDIKIENLQDDLVAISEKVIAEIPINEESVIEIQDINMEKNNEDVQVGIIETSKNVTEDIIEKEEGEITEKSFMERQDIKIEEVQEDVVKTCQKVSEDISHNEDINTEDGIETSQNVTEEISIIEKEGEITEESSKEIQDIKIEDLQDDVIEISQNCQVNENNIENNIIEKENILEMKCLQEDETDTNTSDHTTINAPLSGDNDPMTRPSDDIDATSDISRTSDYQNDSSLDSLMEYIEDRLSSSKKSDDSADNEERASSSKLTENWPNDDDCLDNIKRDFYESTNICSPHPSSESDHAHCVNNLTERVAILSAESILDSLGHGGHGHENGHCDGNGHHTSSDSERTPTLSSPSFDDCNPELYVEKITYGDKELDIVYFEESVLEEGGVQADIKIVRTIPVGLGGRIIGKKGKTKNELMKKFGAQLLIYNHPDEIGKQVLQITCNPSVRDQMERWVTKTLEQITKNTIQTTVSHPEWLKPMIPLGRLVAAHVVDMSTIQHVKVRIYEPAIIKAYHAMQQAMNDDYSNSDNTSLLPRPVAIGCVCVAMVRPDYFLRAQIIDIYDDVARVYLLDIGKVCETYLFYLFKIREKYMRVPFQVIPARLPHALVKNKTISPAIIHKRFLCDQKTMKPKLVRVFFPRMNTCCEPCVNIYIPMSAVSDTGSHGSSPTIDGNEEFVDLLELLVSMDVCSMVRETINSDIQVKINSSHFKAFLNEKDRKQVANVTVPLYFQPCNNKFYEDFVEFKLDSEVTMEEAS